jgi:hypothetical protein
MKPKFLSVLCSFLAPVACFASNEGVPSYYQNNSKTTVNRAAYSNYRKQGYTNYVGNTGKKQVVSTNTYSYQVPRQTYTAVDYGRGAITTNGVATPTDNNKTSIYAGYSRRFADFEFKTGVNSILEWDDMWFNEINVGVKHIFDVRGFDLAVFGNYTHGEMSGGGLSMDYDLEPYDYSSPMDGIFTISMGSQSGDLNHLRFGIGAHHIWDIGGWKITPYIGYEIFKHNLKMSDHLYPNPGVYLPLMTETGDYVFGDLEGNYYAVSPNSAGLLDDDSGFYQICMGPEDIKVVAATTGGNSINGILYPIGKSFTTIDYNSSMGSMPWGVVEGDCVVIGGDGVVKVDGTTHIYNTTWSGFYLGLEIEKQMTLADKLRFYVQVGMPKYSSKGTWPNRDDWQQNPSFLDEGDNGAFSYSAEMEYSYKLSDRIALSVKADTDYFHIGKIPGELYVAEQTVYVEDEDNPGNYTIVTYPAYTEYVSESLSKATWRSFGLHIGLKYSF